MSVVGFYRLSNPFPLMGLDSLPKPSRHLTVVEQFIWVVWEAEAPRHIVSPQRDVLVDRGPSLDGPDPKAWIRLQRRCVG